MNHYGDFIDDPVYDDYYGHESEENSYYKIKDEDDNWGDLPGGVKCEHKDTIQEGGMTICTYCAKVLGESQLVSNHSYDASGHILGKRYKKGKKGVTVPMLGGKGSRRLKSSRKPGNTIGEDTLKLYEKRIERIADVIMRPGMNRESICESAKYFYKIAWYHNVVFGYSPDLVAGACLYLGIRVQKRPPAILLLDISHELKVNLFEVAAVFTRIARFCHICGKDLNQTEPLDFLQRFAKELKFESETIEKRIIATSMKIFQKMKHDWLSLGRTISGVCGACLFIAARIHKSERSRQDIVEVVKISLSTLESRLAEFEKTEASRLTAEDWEQDKQKQLNPHYPPCYIRNRMYEENKLMVDAKEETTSLKRKAMNTTEDRPRKLQKTCQLDSDSNFDDAITSEEYPDPESQNVDLETMILNDDEDFSDVEESMTYTELLWSSVENVNNSKDDLKIVEPELQNESQNEDGNCKESASEYETDDEITNMVMRDNSLIEARETCFDLLYPDFDTTVEERKLKKGRAEIEKKKMTDKPKSYKRGLPKTVEQMRARMMGSEMGKLEMIIKQREKREPSPLYDPFGIQELNDDDDALDDFDEELFDDEDVESVWGKLEPCILDEAGVKCKDGKYQLFENLAASNKPEHKSDQKESISDPMNLLINDGKRTMTVNT